MHDENTPPLKSPASEGLSVKKAKKGVEIVSDGLRYKNKPAGSPFVNKSGGFGSTMSCFKCGKHKPSSELESKKIMGRSQKICKGGCVKT